MQKLITIIALLTMAATSWAIIEPPDDAKLPAVWEKASAQERFKAVRVAQVDAQRKLAERIYGFEIAAGSHVVDFALADDTINSKTQALLRGASELDEVGGHKAPYYTKDGIVYVEYGVPMRKVYEIIEAHVKKSGDKVLQAEYNRRIETVDRLITAEGNGALPNSRGMRLIRAKRAAEMDAYQKMAAKIIGLQVTSKTQVRDFLLASDDIVTAIAGTLKGMKTIKEKELPGDSVEVTMQLKIRNIYEVIDRAIRVHKGAFQTKKEVVTRITEEVEDQYFTVTGVGAPDKPVPAVGGTAPGAGDVFVEERVIIKRLIGSGIEVD